MRDLASHLLDIAQNATTAKSSQVKITIEESPTIVKITIQDNGIGMSEDVLCRVTDPFFTSRTTRKVGLGIPLLQQNSRQTGGDVHITSKPGKGTQVEAQFITSHIDCPPWGNWPQVFALLIAGHPEVHFIYTHRCQQNQFIIDTNEIRHTLEEIPLTHPKVIGFIKTMTRELLNESGSAACS
ncbi:histidine kinase/DNA gyrase B/HSP90-like ATPase [Breznakibacter xylanolyticus]|uniref:histidine kinase n=1 Tax=Breznakibacter xylanolyticus TaxID=990 RepID=A0A2W7NJ72_9BACT|nr:ATP-binding protein [Breznakibacter xylanolyticus]MBN2743780.1 sensor histidine kinase [Marinilabiliaceae bacterium]PZX18177.1 histidine kinase/DNA gyrase B/HSP90-like ATPase [Breznakibacter xylanolyticus]